MFHLLPPMYSTTGKKKGKQKYASAEHKRQAEEQAAEWERKVSAFNKLSPSVKVPDKSMKKLSTSLPRIPVGRGTDKIESLVTNWGPCLKVEDKQYTGTKIKGIGTMHKSNAVPVFSDEEAVEISKMRR
jgi:DNA gyrase/topoisomerase IV subunit B